MCVSHRPTSQQAQWHRQLISFLCGTLPTFLVASACSSVTMSHRLGLRSTSLANIFYYLQPYFPSPQTPLFRAPSLHGIKLFFAYPSEWMGSASRFFLHGWSPHDRADLQHQFGQPVCVHTMIHLSLPTHHTRPHVVPQHPPPRVCRPAVQEHQSPSPPIISVVNKGARNKRTTNI